MEPVAPLVEARQIKKYFYIRPSLLARALARQRDIVVQAVDGVDLAIWPGETLGLVGESGCGKTTLGRVLVRLYEPTAGKIFFHGQEVRGNTVNLPGDSVPNSVSGRAELTPLASARQNHRYAERPGPRRRGPGVQPGQAERSSAPAIRRAANGVTMLQEPGEPKGAEERGGPEGVARSPTVSVSFYQLAQVIFQNPYSSLNPRKTVRDIVSVPLRHRGVTDPHERETETMRLLRRVGLSERHIDSYPHQFSGGQRQRIGIARALAMRPRFVVADEPVSSLDVSIQAQVIALMEELQEEYNLTYLFITHDLSVIYYISDRVAVMYLGKIVEEGPTDALFAAPKHPYTQALLAAIPKVDKAARRERIILEGTVPSPIDPPSGCRFHPRCFAKIGAICENEEPIFTQVGDGQRVACHLYG